MLYFLKENVLFTLLCLQALPFGPHSSNACFVDIMEFFGINERIGFGDFLKKKVDLMVFAELMKCTWTIERRMRG